MLLSVPGDSFFTAYRQKKSKNKSVEEISEYAAEFFKKFLDVKGTLKRLLRLFTLDCSTLPNSNLGVGTGIMRGVIPNVPSASSISDLSLEVEVEWTILRIPTSKSSLMRGRTQ